MKIIFAGTPEFAAIALQALHQAGHEITLVLTQPDRPAGRGMQLQASAVKQYALAHDIPVAQPVSLRLDGKYPEVAREAHALLQSTPHEVMVVAAYGLILPRSILDIAPLGDINIHGSLLPRWRGAAPIHRAIEAGDASTGVTIMRMEEGLDTGPMLSMQALEIGAEETTGELHDRLAALGAAMIVDAIARLAALEAVPQPELGVTYAAKISKDEAQLDFSRPAAELARKIRAFNPFPGAMALFNGVPIKIWAAQVAAGSSSSAPGAVIAADSGEIRQPADVHKAGEIPDAGEPGEPGARRPAGILVACGEGVLRLTILQKPGGKRLPAAEFIKGFEVEGGHFG